jgi:hypothetical protein
MKIGSPAQIKWIRIIIGAIFALNVIDGIFTLYWIYFKRQTELNPFMDFLIAIDPVAFMAIKMILVLFGTFLLWRLRHHAASVVTLFMLFLVYYYMVLFHLNYLDLQLARRILESVRLIF